MMIEIVLMISVLSIAKNIGVGSVTVKLRKELHVRTFSFFFQHWFNEINTANLLHSYGNHIQAGGMYTVFNTDSGGKITHRKKKKMFPFNR